MATEGSFVKVQVNLNFDERYVNGVGRPTDDDLTVDDLDNVTDGQPNVQPQPLPAAAQSYAVPPAAAQPAIVIPAAAPQPVVTPAAAPAVAVAPVNSSPNSVVANQSAQPQAPLPPQNSNSGNSFGQIISSMNLATPQPVDSTISSGDSRPLIIQDLDAIHDIDDKVVPNAGDSIFVFVNGQPFTPQANALNGAPVLGDGTTAPTVAGPQGSVSNPDQKLEVPLNPPPKPRLVARPSSKKQEPTKQKSESSLLYPTKTLEPYTKTDEPIELPELYEREDKHGGFRILRYDIRKSIGAHFSKKQMAKDAADLLKKTPEQFQGLYKNLIKELGFLTTTKGANYVKNLEIVGLNNIREKVKNGDPRAIKFVVVRWFQFLNGLGGEHHEYLGTKRDGTHVYMKYGRPFPEVFPDDLNSNDKLDYTLAAAPGTSSPSQLQELKPAEHERTVSGPTEDGPDVSSSPVPVPVPPARTEPVFPQDDENDEDDSGDYKRPAHPAPFVPLPGTTQTMTKKEEFEAKKLLIKLKYEELADHLGFPPSALKVELGLILPQILEKDPEAMGLLVTRWYEFFNGKGRRWQLLPTAEDEHGVVRCYHWEHGDRFRKVQPEELEINKKNKKKPKNPKDPKDPKDKVKDKEAKSDPRANPKHQLAKVDAIKKILNDNKSKENIIKNLKQKVAVDKTDMGDKIYVTIRPDDLTRFLSTLINKKHFTSEDLEQLSIEPETLSGLSKEVQHQLGENDQKALSQQDAKQKAALEQQLAKEKQEAKQRHWERLKESARNGGCQSLFCETNCTSIATVLYSALECFGCISPPKTFP